MQKIIKFDDGYTVKISPTEVRISLGGKSNKADPIYLRPAAGDKEVSARIRSKGGDPEKYLTNGVAFTVRRWNGVEEAIAQIAGERIAQGKREQEEREAKWAEEREQRRQTIREKTPEWEAQLAALQAQVPSDSVLVNVVQTGSFDGYPTLEYTADGTSVSWSDVTVLGWVGFLGDGECGFIDQPKAVAFIPRQRLDAIRAERQAAAEKAAAEKKHRADDRAQKFAEAARIGKPVGLRSWVTDRCMNGNDQECSFDHATELAMPDGTIKTTYSCCY